MMWKPRFFTVIICARVGLVLLLLVGVSCFPANPAAEINPARTPTRSTDAAFVPSLTSSSCIGGSGPDSDSDGYCDTADTCPVTFNPDQVDLDFDGLGDPCDLAPAISDPSGQSFSRTDTSIVVDPPLPTLVMTPDGGAMLEFDAGAVDVPATLTLVQVVEDFGVEARGTVDAIENTLSQYRLYVGGQAYYAFKNCKTATLTFGLSADNADVSRSYRNHTLAVWALEDTDGDGLENSTTQIANCEGDSATSDGRCSSATLIDNDGDGAADLIQVSADITAVCCNDDSDIDQDGYGIGAGDCNDTDATVYPGATELCDFKDNDCNHVVDDVSVGQGSVWYADADGDGFGNASQITYACSAPTGAVAVAGDCNDGDATFYPGATEQCSGRDNDCDGNANEGFSCFEVSQLDVGKFGE